MIRKSGKMLLAGVGCSLLMPGLASAQVGATPQDRVSSTDKGSLLVWSKVELRWDMAGNLIQDTFLDIANDGTDDVSVQFYYCNGDPATEATATERAHPGWDCMDFKLTLTANQPAFWSVADGTPGPAPQTGTPFTVIDPTGLGGPGRPAMDGSSDRVLRGFVYAWAVADGSDGDPTDGCCPINWNQLKGDAILVNYQDGTAWEYNAWAFQVVIPGSLAGALVPGACANGQPNEGADWGRLKIGTDYAPAYDYLLYDFYAASTLTPGALSNRMDMAQTVTIDGDLTLHPVDANFTQDGQPVSTKAVYVIYDENEVPKSHLNKCITCWDQTLLSLYADSLNFFERLALGTDKGRAVINGVEGPLDCDTAGDCCKIHVSTDQPGSRCDDDDTDCFWIVSSIDPDCSTVALWGDNCVDLAKEFCAGCTAEVPLLGVQAKHLTFAGGGMAAAGGNLHGRGTESTSVYFEPALSGGGPGGNPDPLIDLDPAVLDAVEGVLDLLPAETTQDAPRSRSRSRR